MASDTSVSTPAPAPSNNRRRAVAIGAAVVVAISGYFVWRAFAPREGTDDAQVSGHVSPVATRVGGTVVAIKVADNQAVKAGDGLVELDPRDYELAVARAEADLAVAEAAARGAQRRADHVHQREERSAGR
jgi:membrane fusion protein (multidrug efflux system)